MSWKNSEMLYTSWFLSHWDCRSCLHCPRRKSWAFPHDDLRGCVRDGNRIFDNVSVCQSCALIPKARNQLETILGSFSEDIYSRETEGSEIEKKNTGMLRECCAIYEGVIDREETEEVIMRVVVNIIPNVENSCINWAAVFRSLCLLKPVCCIVSTVSK